MFHIALRSPRPRSDAADVPASPALAQRRPRRAAAPDAAATCDSAPWGAPSTPGRPRTFFSSGHGRGSGGGSGAEAGGGGAGVAAAVAGLSAESIGQAISAALGFGSAPEKQAGPEGGERAGQSAWAARMRFRRQEPTFQVGGGRRGPGEGGFEGAGRLRATAAPGAGPQPAAARPPGGAAGGGRDPRDGAVERRDRRQPRGREPRAARPRTPQRPRDGGGRGEQAGQEGVWNGVCWTHWFEGEGRALVIQPSPAPLPRRRRCTTGGPPEKRPPQRPPPGPRAAHASLRQPLGTSPPPVAPPPPPPGHQGLPERRRARVAGALHRVTAGPPPAGRRALRAAFAPRGAAARDDRRQARPRASAGGGPGPPPRGAAARGRALPPPCGGPASIRPPRMRPVT
jgi:hypothetical protein